MRVRTPASSANLGPGFDCFGLAWQCHNEIEFLPSDELRISGCPERFRNKDNLACAGYLAALEYRALPEAPVEISFVSTDIPVSRGLGSSAALIVGGVRAADAMHGLSLTDSELLAVATRVEGHPDNVAPALFGGLTVSAMEGGRALCSHFALSPRLRFTALIPDGELSTELARSVLPAQVPMRDAVFNVSRAALLLRALEDGDTELLSFALADRLHQPFRTKLIAGYDTAREAASALGAAGMCISGAGSTLLCFSDSESFTGAMAAALAESLPSWRVKALYPDMRGAVAE